MENYLLKEHKKIIKNLNKIIKYINKDNNNNNNNKLIEKKIEYIYFYMKNINEELTDINNIYKENLFLDKKYLENEYNKYINMERTILNYQLTHNL